MAADGTGSKLATLQGVGHGGPARGCLPVARQKEWRLSRNTNRTKKDILYPNAFIWLHSGLLVAVCVALFVSAASVRAGCFLSSPAVLGLVRVLPLLCCWPVLMGRLSALECAFRSFLLLFALLHLFPLLRLFVTYMYPNQRLIPSLSLIHI